MKRSLILTLLIAFLVLGLGVFCEVSNIRISQSYQERLITVGEAIAADDWQRAEQAAERIAVQWESAVSWVQLWVDHGDTDQVSESLRGLLTAIMMADKMNALLYYGDCLENFEHLHHQDAFTLKNIL